MNLPLSLVTRPGWILALALALGLGCQKRNATVLGQAPKGEARTILSVRSGDSPPQVTVSGVMFEKCPTAGCWFYMRDASGAIKVDTKAAGFVVVNVPLEKTVTVTGKVITEGDEVVIQASGLSY